MVSLAYLDVCPEVSLLCTSLFALNYTNGTNSLFGSLDFDNLEGNGLTYEGGEIAILRNAGLGCGNEDAVCIVKNNNAASYSLGYLALENGLVLASVYYVLPILIGICSLFGELCNAFDVADTNDEAFDLVAVFEVLSQLKGGIVCDLFRFYVAGYARTEVQLKLSIGNVSNCSGNDISCI